MTQNLTSEFLNLVEFYYINFNISYVSRDEISDKMPECPKLI